MTAALLVLALIAQTPPAAPPTGDPPAAPSAPAAEKPPALLKIAGVSRLQRSFNPTAGQTATLQFTLSRAAQVAITVYGPNRETVARLLEGKECAAGLNTVVWDGRDLDGAIVPDEAYTFDVRAVAGEDSDLWDPLLNSGGESVRVAELQTLDAERLSYHLPVASRVLVRAAVVNGPLLRTIVNWEPRTAGLCVEQWDGKDADGLRRIADVENTRTAVAAMALPDETIISTGNPAIDYAYYYLTRGASRPHQPPPVRVKKAGEVLSPHWTLPVHVNRDPELSLVIVGVDDMAVPDPAAAGEPAAVADAADQAPVRPTVLRGSPALIRVDLPRPHQRTFLNEQKFEVIVYVDDRRIIEVEQGHVPFTYPWDISSLGAGRHVLTVNVSSFRNHVGTVSRLVQKEP